MNSAVCTHMKHVQAHHTFTTWTCIHQKAPDNTTCRCPHNTTSDISGPDNTTCTCPDNTTSDTGAERKEAVENACGSGTNQCIAIYW